VIVAAAGNGDQRGRGVNTDLVAHTPSGLANENIISVAAKDALRLLTTYSNYGETTVDVIAMGGSVDSPIRSTYVPNPAGKVFVDTQGTSFAAPLVAGIVAQMLEINPALTPSQIRDILVASGREEAGLRGKIASGRVLELPDALQRARSSIGLASR
jgi:subtilisin family serine protease